MKSEEEIDKNLTLRDTVRVYKGTNVLLIPIKKMTEKSLRLSEKYLVEITIRNTGIPAPPDTRVELRRLKKIKREAECLEPEQQV